MAIFQFYVRLMTGKDTGAGTDDRLFLSIFGKHGGREFAIDSADSNVNDFQPGDNVTYTYGSPLLLSSVDPPLINSTVAFDSDSGSGGMNDPELIPLSLIDIEYVSIRKAGARQGAGADDGFQLMDAEAKFWDVGLTRVFRFVSRNPIWLANQSGLQVWLTEERK